MLDWFGMGCKLTVFLFAKQTNPVKQVNGTVILPPPLLCSLYLDQLVKNLYPTCPSHHSFKLGMNKFAYRK